MSNDMRQINDKQMNKVSQQERCISNNVVKKKKKFLLINEF